MFYSVELLILDERPVTGQKVHQTTSNFDPNQSSKTWNQQKT